MQDFIAIGDTTLDVFLIVHEYRLMFDLKKENRYLCVNYADKVPVDSIKEIIAGNAPNAAVAAARAGLKSAIVTQMGDDKTSEMAKELFKREKVSLDYFSQEKGTSSNYSTVIAIDGERTILIYHTPRQYRLPKLKKAKWIYLSSMAHGFEKIFPDLVNFIKKTKTKLLYQPGTFQLRHGPKPASQLLRVTELFVVNRQEAIRYTGSPKDAKIKVLLDRLAGLGPRRVIITDGSRGSYCFDGKDYWQMGILRHIPRKESTGAGDAYTSGVAIALCKNKSMDEAMRWGHFNSSSVIQYIGAQEGLLTAEQYEEWSRKYKSFRAEKF
jgi:fructoselysine 6-kinase